MAKSTTRAGQTETTNETYVALLYSIGIAEGKRLVMAEWREMLEELGFKNPRTLIATGNALFETEKTDIVKLEARLEDAFEKRFGRRVHTIVKHARSFQQLAEGNPFVKESDKDGAQVMVRVMREPLKEDCLELLASYLTNGERVKLVQGHLWVHFKNASNESRLVPVLTAKRMNVGTLRNWNTVRRLNEMLVSERNAD